MADDGTLRPSRVRVAPDHPTGGPPTGTLSVNVPWIGKNDQNDEQVKEVLTEAASTGLITLTGGGSIVLANNGWRLVARHALALGAPTPEDLARAVERHALQRKTSVREAIAELTANERDGYRTELKALCFAVAVHAWERLPAERRDGTEAAFRLVRAVIARAEGRAADEPDGQYVRDLLAELRDDPRLPTGVTDDELCRRIEESAVGELIAAAGLDDDFGELPYLRADAPQDAHLRVVQRDDIEPPMIVREMSRVRPSDFGAPPGTNYADLMSDQELGSFEVAQVLWEQATAQWITLKKSGPALARYKRDPNVGRRWPQPEPVFVIYPDGRVFATSITQWHGLSFLYGSANYCAVAVQGLSHEGDANRPVRSDLLVSPLTTIVTRDGEWLYDPSVASQYLPGYVRSWVSRNPKHCPPTEEDVALAIVGTLPVGSNRETEQLIAAVERATGAAVPRDDEDGLRLALAETFALMIRQQSARAKEARGAPSRSGSPGEAPGVVLVRPSSRFDDPGMTEYVDRWRGRLHEWQRSALKRDEALGRAVAQVLILQPEIVGKDGAGIEFDPPHTLRVSYPSHKVIEVTAWQWFGLLATLDGNEDLFLLVKQAPPQTGLMVLDPRCVVHDATDDKPLYDPRAEVGKLRGRWKQWMHNHPEWPHGQQRQKQPVLFGSNFSVALEELHDTAEWFARTRPFSLDATLERRANGGRAVTTAMAEEERLVLAGFERAAPYFWANGMCDALESMAGSMPDWTCTYDQLHTNAGFVLFQRPLALPEYYGERHDLVSALWFCRQDQSGLRVVFFVSNDTRKRGDVLTMMTWQFGDTLEERVQDMHISTLVDGRDQDITGYMHAEVQGTVQWQARVVAAMRYFAASCVFMNQKIIVTPHKRAERHVRKRVAARYPDEPPAVRVVELRERRYERKDGEPGDREDVTWTHRWWVRRHWRNQFYRSDGSHRPILIEPFVKGPGDRPLVKPPRDLYVIKR